MEILESFFQGQVLLFKCRVFQDERGFFQESYNQKRFEEHGIKKKFIQDNHSYSKHKYTLRGFHFQLPPMAQAKIVRVIHGKVLDVVVDIRKESPTYGKYIQVELSSENLHQLYIGKGLAHGFLSLTDDCHFSYKVDNYYSHEHNAGVIWNDPDINFPWPTTRPILSEQDHLWPTLKNLGTLFTEEGPQ